MPISPYFTGGNTTNFGPPSGLAGLLAQPAQIAAQDRATGSRNIATMLQWVSDQGDKHKATDDAGKAAKLMMSGENSQGQSWLMARGVTPEEQKTWGTKDWATAGQAFHQDQVSQEADARIKTGLAQFAQMAQAAQAQQQDRSAWQKFGQSYSNLTQPVTLNTGAFDPNSPVQDPTLQNFARAAANPAPLNGQESYALALRSGVSPRDALEVAKGGQEVARSQKELAGQSDNSPKGTLVNGTPVIYSDKTGLFQIDPAYAVTQKAAAQKELLAQKLSNLSADEQLKSLDRQEKILTSPDALVMMPDEAQRTAQLQAIQQRRQELLAGKSGGSAAATSGGKMTQAKFDALPSGATYVGNDGKTYRKP